MTDPRPALIALLDAETARLDEGDAVPLVDPISRRIAERLITVQLAADAQSQHDQPAWLALLRWHVACYWRLPPPEAAFDLLRGVACLDCLAADGAVAHQNPPEAVAAVVQGGGIRPGPGDVPHHPLPYPP